jgi:hypothetical protein
MAKNYKYFAFNEMKGEVEHFITLLNHDIFYKSYILSASTFRANPEDGVSNTANVHKE